MLAFYMKSVGIIIKALNKKQKVLKIISTPSIIISFQFVI
jgi:hypothetical protein